jgi:ribosomal protein S18 acetylase RimI-like enzyme
MNLRRATWDDAYPLWLWANDSETRVASGDRPLIPWIEHLAWLRNRVRAEAAIILVGETAEAQPVGSIRFESPDGWASAVLSYVVAPESRGRGFGRALLIEGVATLRRLHPRTLVIATVRPGNTRSARLFERLGWAVGEETLGRLQYLNRGLTAV